MHQGLIPGAGDPGGQDPPPPFWGGDHKKEGRNVAHKRENTPRFSTEQLHGHSIKFQNPEPASGPLL